MQASDVQSIYKELIEKKQVDLPEILTDYDVQVLLQIIALRLKKEHPFWFLQHQDRQIKIL